jgi:hypothetical protein
MHDKTYTKTDLEGERGEWDIELKIYGIDTTVDELMNLMVKDTSNTAVIEDGLITPIRKIFTNKRGNLKLCIIGEFLMVANKDLTAGGMNYLATKWYSGAEKREFFDFLKEDVYVILGSWNHSLLGITDCRNIQDAMKFRDMYLSICETFKRGIQYNEMSDVNRMEVSSVFHMQKVEEYKQLVEETLTQAQKDEKEDFAFRASEVKDKIKISGDGLTTKIVIQALDKHTYTFRNDGDCSLINANDLNWAVWRTRYIRKEPNWQKYIIENTLMSEMLQLIHKMLETRPVYMKVDNKNEVKLELRKYRDTQTVNKTPIYNTYINDKRIKAENLHFILDSYFMKGMPLVVEEEKEVTVDEKNAQKTRLSIMEKRLTENGISGELDDLEGRTPIAFGVEKEGTKWYLIVGSKRVYIAGGIGALMNLETVITGKANKWTSRYSTVELVRRLAELVGQDEAIEMVRQAKDFAKVFNVGAK